MADESLMEHPLWLDKNWLVFSPRGLEYVKRRVSQGTMEFEPSILLYEDAYVPDNRVYGVLNRQSVSYSLEIEDNV